MNPELQTDHVLILPPYVKKTDVLNKLFKLKFDKHWANVQLKILQSEYSWKMD